MASQDRTSEFFSLCQSLPPGLEPPSSAVNPQPSSVSSTKGRYGSSSSVDAAEELRSFHKTASVISKDIYSTSALLTELTSLIHSRSGSLFVDESDKVNNLVLKIKSNIESLNTKLDATNEMIQRNKRRLGKNSQVGIEASNLVGQLQEEFVNTTKDFKKVLQVRSDRMKERNDRENLLLGNDTDNHGEKLERISLLGNKPKIYNSRNNTDIAAGSNGQFASQTVNSFGAGGRGGGNENILGGFSNGGPRLDLVGAIMQNSSQQMQPGESTMQLPRPYGIKHEDGSYSPSTGMRLRHTPSSFSNYDGNAPSSSLPVYTPLDIQKMEEQSGQSQMMQLIPDQNYLRERADAMSAVESNIVELGTIFNKLAVMVNEHSEMVQRIEDNVDSANDNILLSLNTLTDTLDNLRSNRQLFFRLMAVLVIFVIVFITVFA